MDKEKYKKSVDGSSKQEQLDEFRVQNTGKPLTTNDGRKISDDQHQLKAGERGPSLQEDVHYFEKMTHFVNEEIPERVVHARGYSAHGEFECYQSMKHVTKACFLQEPGKKTPLTVRFSTVQGAKGSYDTARDLRCQGVKFYTEEGNYDLTTIAMPVLINQEAMKFPDAMHAYQTKQDNDIPTASGAHDLFWDYVANNDEALHMVLWIMSDRGILRSYRMMESWAINTYLFVNDKGVATFVRFVWKPVLGVHSLLQDEALKIGGLDPDFHRRDLREAIDMGAYPEYELGVQLIPMEDEFKYDFDVLDPAKFWPEEVVPVHIIGKMTLNRNIDNYFTESEQVAFNPAHVVPGIDFSNDPVLQGRLIAYQSAQYHRLGANFHELPINRPICPFHNNQRRGPMRNRIDVDQVNYHKNSLANNTPYETPPEQGGYEHYPQKVEGHVIRNRSDSFKDYFSQPRIFWNSLTPVEKQHTIEGISYQVGSVKSKFVRQQVVNMLVNVDQEMAYIVADNLGVDRPGGAHVPVSKSYPSLSQATTPRYAYTQKVGVLIGNGFNDQEVAHVLNILKQNGVFIEIVSEKLGAVAGAYGTQINIDKTFLTTSPHLLDSLYVVGGSSRNQTKFNQVVMSFISEAYSHYKPIGVATTGQPYVIISKNNNLAGVVFAANNPNFGNEFVTAIAQHRFWNRK
ncbi:Catalase HPII (plasmid) [Paenibacillus larvae subsp. larvae]|uniref:Catalase n=1 Tax=Paenibacillus larvae subsp. larvae TaxID=147375 RepID=A0A2L1UKA7_9BACL|nr:catalase [Paenibacillus larvae]AQT86979.1 catalase HPII [Paenibacillus larvae subsp. pulvifaciens]AQZ49308.1 catalase HPII [Paenibacillus larvae subsp. pulvifaciens]AVF28962.1 Catalase HPII [Paenibacillus larvae subsp. larvae]AVF33344.1 Catalase HPII [Paenibacillus larvae subsp. larvae]MBH0341353.1 catalase [Paenibacillus larvae]